MELFRVVYKNLYTDLEGLFGLKMEGII